jgi:hypothetical protein
MIVKLNGCPPKGGFGDVVVPPMEGGVGELELTTILAVAVLFSPALFITLRVTLYEPGNNCASNTGKVFWIVDWLVDSVLF